MPNTPASSSAQRDFRVNNFDLLRILAAIQVLVIHTMHRLEIPIPVWLKPLEWFPGVPIFFCISGYLVSASLERQQGIGRYFRNRFLRIYPGLWVCVTVTAILVLALGYRPAHPMDFLWLPMQFVGIIFTPHFLEQFGTGTYNGSLWTIPIELQFYLMLPLVYRFRSAFRLGKAGFFLIFAFFVGVTFALPALLPGFNTDAENSLDKLLRYSFIPSFYMFLLGVLLQRLQVYRLRLFAGKGFYWVVAYGALRWAIPVADTVARDVLCSLALGLTVISAAYTLPTLGEFLLRGQDISYGVYIYHGLIINLLVGLKMPSNPYQVGIVLIGAVTLASLSWKFVEEPFLRKKRKIKAPAAPVALHPGVPEPQGE